MKLRRTFLQFAAAVAASLAAISQLAGAQTYPSRPITMVVPFAAGGSADAVGRIVAERMRRSLGQPVIIENVSGADGSIGTGRVARARPDGYTFGLGFMDANVLNGAFYSLRYDLLNDLEPISPLVTTPAVLFANKTMPARDLNELIAWLKANPNKASAGIVSLGLRLITVFFQRETNTHFVLGPYRGGAARIQDLAAGQIDLSFGLADYLRLTRASSIKAYAVTSNMRMAVAPDIPTFLEFGLRSLCFSDWFGIFVPKGTPKDIVGRLNGAAVETLEDPTVRSRLADLGYDVFPRERQTPEALAALVRAGVAKWWPIIKELGIKAE
jgi:tripartite-type tricarboxylate transporter receptor subunit TctC